MLNLKLFLSRKCYSQNYYLLFLVITVWFILFQDALLSSARIWYISEIFSHGFFIIPGALYFIWRDRSKLKNLELRPNYWVLSLLIPCLVFGLVGDIGGIQVFSHISAFIVLPLAVWFCVGNAIAKVIWFPLCFILFSIPIGEELVPYLQRITADMAVAILGWTAIPSYTTGLYIEIPQGKFVVAEACSGIRFFIGSIVFGAVYSHVSYRSFPRKAIFMLLALLVPIVANAVRVFGIVVIGYYSDMKYASGADHIIYGWVFFCVVLFLLVLLGEAFREKKSEAISDESNTGGGADIKHEVPKVPSLILLILLSASIFWQQSVSLDENRISSIIDRDIIQTLSQEQAFTVSQWSPIFRGETDLYHGTLVTQEASVDGTDLVLAWYAENREDVELVSSLNALYDKESWSVLGSSALTIDFGDAKSAVQLLRIVSTLGEQRMVLYWYQLPDKIERSRIKAKLYQTLDVLLGGKGAGALVAVSSAYTGSNEQEVRERLLATAVKHRVLIFKAIPF